MRLRPAPRGARRPATPRAWLAVLVVLAFALSWQNFLFQTHGHPAPAAQAAGASPAAIAPRTDPQGPVDQQKTCPICLEIANATPALPSAPVALPLPLVVAFFIAAFALAAAAPSRPAPPWQSRAPPLPLQV